MGRVPPVPPCSEAHDVSPSYGEVTRTERLSFVGLMAVNVSSSKTAVICRVSWSKGQLAARLEVRDIRDSVRVGVVN